MPEVAHILLVQDDPADRHRAVHALASAGWQASELASGAACLAAVRRNPALIVVLDLRLSDMDGRELLEQIAAAHPQTPAVVLTEVDDLAVAIDAMQRGAWDYVVKRPDQGHLVELPRVIARSLARRELLRERDRYRQEVEGLAIALRGTTDGVVVADPSGRISFVNPALAKAWQYPEAEIIGRMVETFVKFPAGEGDFRDVFSAVGQQGRWTGILEARTAGVPRPVWEVTLTPIRSAARVAAETGTPAMVGIFRDVSEKCALEQMRADLLSMVTHDIKVPLTVILGYTEMLADPERPPGEVPRDIVTRIRESGEQIHGLVCNFLDLSRIEAGRLTLSLQAFDLAAMLRRIFDQQTASARRKGLVVAAPDLATLTVVGDEGQLERVMANLLSNALKFTASGGHVTVATHVENGCVEVAFEDTGRGIPADELAHLFEKYRRVREGQRTEGTGLGLFIAKTIVEAHGGQLRVESVPGKGATFTVRLPVGGV